MVKIAKNSHMVFAGTENPLAYLELKSIDLNEEQTPALSQALCELVGEYCGIAQDRVYIEFSNSKRSMWGWNGKTF